MLRILKKVLRGIGLVCLLLAFGVLPAVFLNTVYGYLPLLLLLLLPALSLGCLLRLKHCVVIDADTRDLQCVRGEAVDIGLKLVNRSRLACPHGVAQVYISDLFGQRDEAMRIPFCVEGRGSVDFGFGLDMSHIGLYRVGFEQIELYDPLGLFHFRLPMEGAFSAFVTPRIRSLEEFHIVEEVLAEASTDTRITVVGGTDYTGVRDYVPGDPMKQIHWKLSAHSRGYLTKLQESNRQQDYVVVLDFAAPLCESHERLMELNDCLIETALSLIEDIARHDAGYRLLYFGRNGELVRRIPAGREEDLELIRSFPVITPEPPAEFYDAAQLLQQEARRQNRSTNVLVVTSRVTPELLNELQRVKRQKRSPELYYILSADCTSRQLEELTAPLRQLEDFEIPWYPISTAENLKASVPSSGGGDRR